MESAFDYYFFNQESVLFHISFNFVVGLAFSPYSDGGKFFCFYLLTMILLDIYATKFDSRYWSIETALVKLCSSFLGFVIGRTISGFKDPFTNELTDQEKNNQEFAKKRSLIYVR